MERGVHPRLKRGRLAKIYTYGGYKYSRLDDAVN
jgi:hypothetical protein